MVLKNPLIARMGNRIRFLKLEILFVVVKLDSLDSIAMCICCLVKRVGKDSWSTEKNTNFRSASKKKELQHY